MATCALLLDLHKEMYIDRQREVKLDRTREEQSGHFLITTRLAQRKIHTQRRIYKESMNQRGTR